MHGGVLAAVAGETVVAVLGGGFVELGPDAFGGDGGCDPHAAIPTQPITMISVRIAFDMGALSD
jgi:hypothetical protein